MRGGRALAAIGLVAAALRHGGAEPYRLRADALASAQAPAGLFVLQAEAERGRLLDAEALIWLGAGEEGEAQALVVAVRARRRSGAAEARVGRFVVTGGGLRPMHIDGAQARVRLPYHLAIESFAGSPVAAGQGGRSFDWLVGGRASRALGDWGSAGVAFVHRRDGGQLADEEIAVDASGAATDWLDLSARAALDLVHVGLAEANGAAGAHLGDWRVEISATERSPARLLPATSLFSVLGDQHSRQLVGQVRWWAAPRLDLSASGGLVGAAGDWGETMSARALLRLDDRGDGVIAGELRREWGPAGGWSGGRATARAPLGAYIIAFEGELAAPERSTGDGALWPWGLASLGRRLGQWEVAAAVEASSSSDYRYRIDAIARLSRLWEAP
jgi:hypothetical protein